MFYPGLPQGQEKSENQEKSGKNGVFETSQEKSFQKHQILSVQIYETSYIQKPSNGIKFFKVRLKLQKLSYNFTKLLNF